MAALAADPAADPAVSRLAGQILASWTLMHEMRARDADHRPAARSSRPAGASGRCLRGSGLVAAPA
ncbi:MAG TPA: hypothetical protein DEH11_21380 [Actinobacteria bacterium]|nr:hypothetical protein [Actinomycetota bacterium]